MELISSLFIGFALAMDSFTVSICGGATLKKIKLKDSLTVALYFGFFQGAMALLGWCLGTSFSTIIDSFDHWIALILLLVIGGKMIIESFQPNGKTTFSMDHKVLIVLAISTSIDALGIGLSYAFLNTPIVLASFIIGLISFILSGLGLLMGKILKKIIHKKAELIGGIILIAIGINIAVEHNAFSFIFNS